MKKANLNVVEKVEQTASMYGKSVQGHTICLLVKMPVSSTLNKDLLQKLTFIFCVLAIKQTDC